MIKVRIIEIPKMKAVYSGPLQTEKEFEAFNNWFSKYHASLKGELYPRDFMWYNERRGVREWFYALPAYADVKDCGGFKICDLPSGLFAVASCLDADIDKAEDWLKTRQELIDWISASKRFELYVNGEGKEERYPMFHIVSPGRMISSGVSIEDLYMPICEV